MKSVIRFLFKVIAIPFIVALTVITPFLHFIFCLLEWVCTVAAVIIAGAGIIMLCTGYSVFSSMGLVVIGFLVSPFGLQRVIEWFIDKLYDFNTSLKTFVTG